MQCEERAILSGERLNGLAEIESDFGFERVLNSRLGSQLDRRTATPEPTVIRA
jgi:hypothetical protein